MSKKPLVGFGVVGTNTLINFLLVFRVISPEFSFVANPTAHDPFLGYSTRTTFFFDFSVFVNVCGNKIWLSVEPQLLKDYF